MKLSSLSKITKEGENHNIYDVIPDSHNNAYFTDFANEQIGRIDAKTGEIKLYNIPTKGAAPRRGQMDAQDRVWFGEYKGNKVGMFDPKTEKFTEWTAPTAFSAPYDVQLDKNGDAWTGSMTTDRVLRLDPKTGQDHGVYAAALDQHPPRVRRQYDHAAVVLGRQQSRRVDREGRAAGLAAAEGPDPAACPDLRSVSFVRGIEGRLGAATAPDYASAERAHRPLASGHAAASTL